MAEKLKTDKGVKDTFQEFFLDKISSAIKNKRTVAERLEAIKNIPDLPHNPLNPVFCLSGTLPYHYCKRDDNKRERLGSSLTYTSGDSACHITGCAEVLLAQCYSASTQKRRLKEEEALK